MFSTLVADPNIVDADIAMYDEVRRSSSGKFEDLDNGEDFWAQGAKERLTSNSVMKGVYSSRLCVSNLSYNKYG